MMDRNRVSPEEYLRIIASAPPMPKKRGKYGNVKVTVDGMTFDSKHEAKAYGELKLLKAGGVVEEFECQAEYPLVVNGAKICTYIADFVVNFADGREEVWDAKGFRTKEYIIKKKMLKALYGHDIVEKGIKPKKEKKKYVKKQRFI